MPVRCVVFDADDTLWDFTTAMVQGLQLAIEAAQDSGPAATSTLSVEDLIARLNRLYADDLLAAPRPGAPIASLRPRSFTLALADLGIDDPDLVEHMGAVYFRAPPRQPAPVPRERRRPR